MRGRAQRERNGEHRHPMPGNRHTKRPDKSLGRSIAPRGSSRSNCQVKAILHGGIETEAEKRGKGTEGAGRAFCCNFDLLPHNEMNPKS